MCRAGQCHQNGTRRKRASHETIHGRLMLSRPRGGGKAARTNSRWELSHVLETRSAGRRMPEPMTPVPNRVDRLLPKEIQTDGPRLVENAQVQGRPVVVIGSPGDIPRVLEHPAVLNGRFGIRAALAIEPGN